jgi:hypothetical protein
MEGYGDRLARGGASASFPASNGKITQEKWDAAFEDYEPDWDAIKKNEIAQEGTTTGEKEQK